MDNEPIINEIVGITFDTDGFAQALQHMATVYEAFLKGLGELGVNAEALKGLDPAPLIEGFQKLRSEIAKMALSAASAIREANEEIILSDDEAAKKQIANAKAVAEAKLDAATGEGARNAGESLNEGFALKNYATSLFTSSVRETLKMEDPEIKGWVEEMNALLAGVQKQFKEVVKAVLKDGDAATAESLVENIRQASERIIDLRGQLKAKLSGQDNVEEINYDNSIATMRQLEAMEKARAAERTEQAKVQADIEKAYAQDRAETEASVVKTTADTWKQYNADKKTEANQIESLYKERTAQHAQDAKVQSEIEQAYAEDRARTETEVAKTTAAAWDEYHKQEENAYANLERQLRERASIDRLSAAMRAEDAQKAQQVFEENNAEAIARMERSAAAALNRVRANADFGDNKTRLSENEEEKVLNEQLAAAFDKAKAAADQLAEAKEKLSIAGMQEAESALKEAAAESEQIRNRLESNIKQGSSGNGFGDFLVSMGENVAQVVKFNVLWSSVGAIINGISDVLKSPFVALESGSKYLTEMEQSADQLAGVIAGAVKYSDDFAENMRQSRTAAQAVMEKLHEISADDHIPVQNLQMAFEAMAQNGAGKMVTNMKELVGVTEIFALAVQASGRSVEGVRSLTSEIPKLMADNVSGSERLLSSLGLTRQEWENIRAEALKHHNLLELIQGKSEILRKAVDDWKNSQATVTAELKEDLEQLEAFYAHAIWEKIKGVLIEIRDYISQHKDVLEAVAKVLGDVVLHLFNTIATVMKTFFNIGEGGNVPPLVAMLINVASWLDKIAIRAEGIAGWYNQKANGASDPNSLLARDEELGNKEGHSVFATRSPEHEEVHKEIHALRERMENIQQRIELENIRNGTVKNYADDPEYQKAFGELYGNVKEDKTDYIGNMHKQLADVEERRKQLLSGQTQPSDKSDPFGNPVTSLIDALNKPFDATKNTPEHKEKYDDTYLRELEEQYNNGRKIIEANYAEQLKDASGPGEEAYNKRKALRDQELRDLQEWNAAAASGLAQASAQLSASHPAALQRFAGTLATQLQTDQDKLTGQQSEDTNRFNTQQNTIRVESDTRNIRGIDRDLAAEVAGVRAAEQAKEITRSQAIQRELELNQKAHEQKVTILNQEISDFGIWSREGARAYDLLTTETDTYNSKAIAGATALRAALRAEALELDQLRIKSQETSAQGLAGRIQTQRASGAPEVELRRMEAELAREDANIAKQKSALAQRELQTVAALYVLHQATTAELLKQKDVADALAAQANQKTAAATKATSEATFSGALTSNVFGTDTPFNKVDDKGNKGDFDMGKTLNSLNHAFSTFDGSVNKIVNGFKEGGALGGISAISGQLAQMIPGIGGAIAGVVSSVTGMLSSLFTAAAKRIADDFKNQMNDTMTAYNNQQATLKQTLSEIQRERAQFIQEESGRKGGNDQMKKLLPQFDQQIADLQKQQKQILTDFNQQTAQLNLQSTTLGNVLKTWQDINKQVSAYIGAGGDIATAQQYMNQQLATLQKNAQGALVDGQLQAVNDAKQLNDLIQQRINLQMQYSKTVFDTLNKDSLERRASNAVSTGMDIQQQTYQYAQQMQQLNQQLQLTQAKVALESQVYQIAKDTAGLQQQSLQLQLYTLQQSLQAARDNQRILQGITKDANGNYAMSQGLQQYIGAININLSNPTDFTPQQLSDAIMTSIADRARGGMGTSLPRYNYTG